MKTGLVFLVSVCMYAVAASSLGANKTNREVVVNQLCQHSSANTLREITSQVKKEFETLNKELTQQLMKMNKKDNGGISKRIKTQLKKEFETLKKELTQQLMKMNKKDNGGILKWNKFFLFSLIFLSFFLVFRLGGREAMNTNTLRIELIKFYDSMLSEILKLPVRNCRQAVDRSFRNRTLIIGLLKVL